METDEFDRFYRRYVEVCKQAGIEPLSRDEAERRRTELLDQLGQAMQAGPTPRSTLN
jgi:hypothetical protein